MYRIRFHGRGGQGIKTASQILGTALFLEGFEVQDAQRYGAERRGAPIFAYVRASREPINDRGLITRPDLVVVADETLVPMPAAAILQGVSERTVMLINSAVDPEQWRRRLNLHGPLLALPAGGAMEARDVPFIGAACAGAAARLLGAVARESLQQAIREEVAKLGAAAVHRNLEQAVAAYDAMAVHEGIVTEGRAVSASDYRAPEWIDELPLDEARVAAPDVTRPANSALVNTGAWRTQRPVIDYDLCNRCSWVCSTLCPDSAIDVDAGHTPRIDYDHCKGCMVCVAVCPPHAIRAERESHDLASGR
jgi:pyruvate ferredoxin oxidoreductase gamma subunit